MSDLLAARLQMAISLGFHIVFAAIGMAMPFLMSIVYARYLKTKKQVYLDVTKAWSKGVAIFFAVGAVSGTALSFELGLLWPTFMKHAGPIIGMPFSWEGAAFFLEAIFLGIFLYGWNRVSPRMHFVSGLMVGICGVASAIFVVCANSFMNSPAGFNWVLGQAQNINPWAAMFNQAALSQCIHMVIAAFEATAFAVAGIHAFGLLRNRKSEFHQVALKTALGVAAIFAILQPLSGDFSARDVAKRQPAKFAAMEALFHTSQPADFLIGGIPDSKTETVRYGIHIPKMLGFLAYHDFNAKVTGLDAFPKENWPPVLIVHIAFQIMIALGSFLLLLGMVSIFFRLKRGGEFKNTWFLRILVFATPLGFLALEAGWVVTEVGRQPFIIYGILKTKDSLTPMPGLVFPMALFIGLYLFLSVMVSWLMKRQFQNVETQPEQ